MLLLCFPEENVVFCKPTCLQTDIYKNILAQDDIKYILTQYNPCECESGLTKGRCCHKVQQVIENKYIRLLYITL